MVSAIERHQISSVKAIAIDVFQYVDVVFVAVIEDDD